MTNILKGLFTCRHCMEKNKQIQGLIDISTALFDEQKLLLSQLNLNRSQQNVKNVNNDIRVAEKKE
jgi:hypothetical protein